MRTDGRLVALLILAACGPSAGAPPSPDTGMASRGIRNASATRIRSSTLRPYHPIVSSVMDDIRKPSRLTRFQLGFRP